MYIYKAKLRVSTYKVLDLTLIHCTQAGNAIEYKYLNNVFPNNIY